MKKKTSAEINEFIKANYAIMSNRELSAKLGISSAAIQKRAYAMGLLKDKTKETPFETQVQEDKIKSQVGKKLKDQDKKYSILLKENEFLQKMLGATKIIEDVNTFEIKKSQSSIGDATAVAVLSDWHWWEIVYPERIDGLNEFNPNIAKERATICFQSIVTLLEISQRDNKISTLVLALLGDFINNQINSGGDDNFGAIAHETLDVQNTLCSGIEYILKNTNVDIVIPCATGNHGRTSEKVIVSNIAGHSIEYFMYQQMANYFRNEKRVKFIISEGYFIYYSVADFVMRFHHGDFIRYSGGVGGISIPANKAIAQWNKSKHADLDIFGHYHQAKDGGNFVSNGSLVGYNGFALSIKADYEKPKQVYFLISHKRKEKTVTCPIFLNN